MAYRKIRAEMDVLAHNGNSDNQWNDNHYEVSSQSDYQLYVNSDHNVSSEGSVHFTDSSEENASSGSELEMISDAEGKPTLSEDLASWATSNALSSKTVNEILDILRRNGHCLTKDQRTLLKTPQKFSGTGKCGGQYFYFGLESELLKLLAQKSICLYN